MPVRKPRKPKTGIAWSRRQFDCIGKRWDGTEIVIRALKPEGFVVDGRTFPTLADAVAHVEGR
jgi:hypothetical protein